MAENEAQARDGVRAADGTTPSASSRPPLVARVIMWPLLAILLIHTLLIGLWVAPSTAFRDAVGYDRVHDYIDPWFEQNWSLFAPTPRRGEVMFEARAFVVDPDTGEGEPTEWARLTEIEHELVRGTPAPPRTMKVTRRTTSYLHTARNDMNDEQRDLLTANFFETPIEELRTMLDDVDGGSSSAVDRYMRADAVATLIANAYAEATWGDQGEIARVQYRTSSRRVPPYEIGSEKTLDDVDPLVREYGWRHHRELTDEQIELFAQYASTEVD